MRSATRLAIVLVGFVLTCNSGTTPALAGETADGVWVPIRDRVAVWDAVTERPMRGQSERTAVPRYNVSANSLEATFVDGPHQWTIIGANSAIVKPTFPPQTWPVKGSMFELAVLRDAITNEAVLPFSERLPATIPGAALSITGAPDSYEAASFVIRAGDEDLRQIVIEPSDLHPISGNGFIHKADVDVRVVKCWYQAGDALSDTKHKMLRPELLLHDDDVVRVDYARQVNLVRDYDRIEDATAIRRLDVPAHHNKQFWVTVHIREGTRGSIYTGTITLRVAGKVSDLKIRVEVLPIALPQPEATYALYYEGVITNENGFRPEAHRKTEAQLRADLLDMREHGLSNATVAHDVGTNPVVDPALWSLLGRTLDARRSVGWGSQPLLYLDWHARGSDTLTAYQAKIRQIVAVAKSHGVRDVYLYGIDEQRGAHFEALKPLYRAVHEAGAKNFVSIDQQTYLAQGRGVIDLPIVWGPSVQGNHIAELKAQGIRAWKYSDPQAGLEEPATYRNKYGVNLLTVGFSGACDYQYQRHSWNDFDDPRGRMNTMAYPTVTGPVSTIEWEGWRTAVDDVRYVTYVLRTGLAHRDWVGRNCLGSPAACRAAAITLIRNSIHR